MAEEIVSSSCDSATSSSDPEELEAIKARVREMEEETEKLKKMQKDLAQQMNWRPPAGRAGAPTTRAEEQVEADARSVFVGNVDYGATAEELAALFRGCGSVRRVTILCDRFSGHPKGFAYVEFSDTASAKTSLALDEAVFRGRQIRVVPKRTNRPGLSTTDRGFPGAGHAPRGSSRSRPSSRGSRAVPSGPRGRVYRGRARAASWRAPY